VRRSLFGTVVAVIAIVGYLLRPPVPVRFQNRMLVQPPSIMRILYRPPTQAEIDDYARLVNQSLLIRAVPLVDDPAAMGPGFTFPEVVAKAFAPLGVTDAGQIDSEFRSLADSEGNVFALLNKVWGNGANRTVKNIPLRLLAVVNRMDQAVVGCQGYGGCLKPGKPPCTGEHLCGAEVRFVYAGVASPSAPFFTLIVEFSLLSVSKPDFLALASKWANLQTGDPNDAGFPMMVGDVLRYCWSLPSGMTARMRVNAKTNDGVWKLRQYQFTATGLAATDLFQQFYQQIQVDSDCQYQNELYDFAAANHDPIIQNLYEFTKPPLPSSGFDMGLPAGKRKKNVLTFADTLPIADQDVIRHNLSSDSCSGCHGWETKPVVDPDSIEALAPFDQIQYREKGNLSQLTAFLTGNKTGAVSGTPTLDSWTMTPPAVLDVVHGCSGRAKDVSYNDLLRRKTYLLGVRGLSPSDSDAVWYAVLANSAGLSLD